jgi:hypothetical protein
MARDFSSMSPYGTMSSRFLGRGLCSRGSSAAAAVSGRAVSSVPPRFLFALSLIRVCIGLRMGESGHSEVA